MRLTIAGEMQFGSDLLVGAAAQNFYLLDNRLRPRPVQRMRPGAAITQQPGLRDCTDLRTVRGQTPAASPAAFGVCPLKHLPYNALSTMRR